MAAHIEVRKTAEFDDWLTALRDRTARRRINDRLLRIAGGLLGDHKPIDGMVAELRFHFGPGYRVYYALRDDGTVVILLGGGDKASQTRDIVRARRVAERELTE